MKYNILKGATAVVAGLLMASCSDFLDVEPHNQITDAAVWGNIDLANAALNDCYVFVEGENENGVPFCSYTDDVFHRTGYATEVYCLGNVSPDNYNVGFSEARGNAWNFYYKGIKEINELLSHIDNVPVSGESEETQKKYIKGQGYFLRAFFYHQLYSLYGRVSIVKHTFNLNDNFKEKRAPMDSVADFICADCDSAATLLPTAYSNAEKDFGRATKGAALAVKARTLFYKASPLFGTTSRERWQAAAKANKAVIDLGVYHLTQVSNADEYAAIFYNPEDPEIIFEKLYNTKDPEGGALNYLFEAPMGTDAGFHGWGVWLPTYNAANFYENADGSKFQMQDVKKYRVSIPTVQDGQVVYADKMIDATKVNPYKNREMRFYANIICDSTMWGYGSTRQPVGIYEPGEPGVVPGHSSPSYTDGEYWNATQTGYYMKKFLNPNYNTDQDNEVDTTPWIFFRLSEFYLNYAECEMELGNNAEALKYINLIRERVHLPADTGKDIREEYEYERRAELMFEGQRFFDLRRWKKMPEAYSGDNLPTAMKIYKMKDGTLYYTHDKTVLQNRKFRDAMYWMPVPRYELNKDPNIDGKPYE